ncbi:MAG TPA: tRNA (adenosine(37)-N6)-threonylcarbamoyltransferase complex dimerization subunit type 1 TsaB [Flavisolibacter sp.]|jgi:tRNA threonylcarbamoyladenosine biosynthesis protein TsaB
MVRILHIDTAIEAASLCLSEDENILAAAVNPSQKDSASWLHVAIGRMLEERGLSPKQLDAVAVSAGPGSYTGLRVGMSAAKGLCFALDRPLIAVSTLKMMAVAAVDEPSALLCPMIDARRMEVFTAVYDHGLSEKLAPANLILTEQSFLPWLEQDTVCFFGNGSAKFRQLVAHPNARFAELEITARQMVPLALDSFQRSDFADLAYSTPFYGKDFHSPASI